MGGQIKGTDEKIESVPSCFEGGNREENLMAALDMWIWSNISVFIFYYKPKNYFRFGCNDNILFRSLIFIKPIITQMRIIKKYL